MIRNSSVDKGFFFVRIECDQSGDLTSVLSGQVLIREMGLQSRLPYIKAKVITASSMLLVYFLYINLARV